MGRIAVAGLVALVALLASSGSAAAAPAWLPGEKAFGEIEGRATTAAMSPDGTVTTAQLRPTVGFEAALEVRTRPPGGAFGATETIDAAASTFTAPILVAAPDGSVAVVYGRSSGTWASMRAPGGSFGTPRLLSTTTGATGETVTFDDTGRLWFIHALSKSFVASTLGPTGSATDLTVDTAPPASPEFFASTASVGVSPAGQVRVAYEFSTFPNPSGPVCTQTYLLREADGGAFGFAAPATLATTEAAGFGSPCTLQTGTTMSAARLATTSDGATTVIYGVNEIGIPTSTVTARHRPAGGAWPAPASAAETVATTSSPALSITGAGATPLAAISTFGLPNAIALTSRNPEGTWTAPQTVTGPAGGSAPRLASSTSGAAVVAWRQSSLPYKVEAIVRSPSGVLSAPATVSDAQDNFAILGGAGVDDEGNAVAGWSTHIGSAPTTGYRATVAGYDGAGPRFTSLNVPPAGLAGQSLDFSASAVDVWSPVAPLSWQFGDGGSASGGAVSHAFGPGPYTVSAAATDAVGNATTTSRPLEVSAAAAPPAPAIAKDGKDTTPPKLTKVVLKPKKVGHGKAAVLSFALSEAATVRVTVARTANGVKRGRKCVKAQRKAHGKTKSCRRLVTVRSLSGRFGAGAASLALPKTLAVGGYRLSVQATDAAGNASLPPLELSLTVVRVARP